MKRVNVVGTSGSGKSSFSRALAERLNSTYIEMDSLFWKPNWEEPSDDEFFEKLINALQGDSWVLDGNYSRSTDVKWSRVDTVIWLDYSFSRTLYQVIKRSLHRAWKKEELWPGTGNTESFYRTLFTRDSMIRWMLTTYHKKRRRYVALFEMPQYEHIEFIRLRSPAQAREFIQAVSQESSDI